MSWKTFLFIASICTVANPFHLSAREPSFIRPSSTPPVIVNANDDQRYNVHDKFIVKQGADERRMESLTSLFPRMNETATTTDRRPVLVQKMVESKKATPRQAATEPKLTVVVSSKPEPKETVDDTDAGNVVKTPAPSMHRHHYHHHHNHHIARHNQHVHRHDNRHQTDAKKSLYGRTSKLHIR